MNKIAQTKIYLKETFADLGSLQSAVSLFQWIKMIAAAHPARTEVHVLTE